MTARNKINLSRLLEAATLKGVKSLAGLGKLLGISYQQALNLKNKGECNIFTGIKIKNILGENIVEGL